MLHSQTFLVQFVIMSELDTTGRIPTYNRAFELRFGYSQDTNLSLYCQETRCLVLKNFDASLKIYDS
jgi:hypothetical protein